MAGWALMRGSSEAAQPQGQSGGEQHSWERELFYRFSPLSFRENPPNLFMSVVKFIYGAVSISFKYTYFHTEPLRHHCHTDSVRWWGEDGWSTLRPEEDGDDDGSQSQSVAVGSSKCTNEGQLATGAATTEECVTIFIPACTRALYTH